MENQIRPAKKMLIANNSYNKLRPNQIQHVLKELFSIDCIWSAVEVKSEEAQSIHPIFIFDSKYKEKDALINKILVKFCIKHYEYTG